MKHGLELYRLLRDIEEDEPLVTHTYIPMNGRAVRAYYIDDEEWNERNK